MVIQNLIYSSLDHLGLIMEISQIIVIKLSSVISNSKTKTQKNREPCRQTYQRLWKHYLSSCGGGGGGGGVILCRCPYAVMLLCITTKCHDSLTRSSRGTGSLWGESTSDWRIPPRDDQWCVHFWLLAWTQFWTSHRFIGTFRRHVAYCDMLSPRHQPGSALCTNTASI